MQSKDPKTSCYVAEMLAKLMPVLQARAMMQTIFS